MSCVCKTINLRSTKFLENEEHDEPPSLCIGYNTELFCWLQVVTRTRVIFSAILCSSAFLTGAAEASPEFPLDKIFWPEPKIQEINNIHVVAYFKDGDNASYLLKFLDTGELVLLKLNDEFQFAKYRLVFKGVEDGHLIFASQANEKFVLRMQGLDAASIAADETTEVSTLSVTRKSDEKVQFAQAKELARILGVPSILVNSFDVMPEYGVSRGGRKGLLLGEGVPKLFFTFTPFQRGDILLGVDGIPFTEVDKLLEHINVKGKGSSYAVELQRDKRLRLLNVYMK